MLALIGVRVSYKDEEICLFLIVVIKQLRLGKYILDERFPDMPLDKGQLSQHI